jgi:hypothetical protein
MRSKSASLIRRAGANGKAFWLYAAVALAPWASGCAPQLAHNYRRLRPELAAHHTADALRYLEGAKDSIYGPNNELLYLMDRAMVQRLWSQSLAHQTLAWLSNDNALPYQGEDFEKVFLHLLEALSYARAGNLSDAQVEARQVSARLQALNAQLSGKAITYQDDAFAHYLAGMLFEADSEDLSHLSDARIEYERAVHLYETVEGPAYQVPAPRHLVEALGGVYAKLGADGAEQLGALTSRYHDLITDGRAVRTKAQNRARLTVVALVGEAPRKVEAFWELVVWPNVYKVAYPSFLPHSKRPPPRVMLQEGAMQLQPELVMDVQKIAIRNLGDHMDRIKNRVLTREVAKYAAGTVAEGVGLERGGLWGLGTYLAGFALNTATAASARADTRSWTTLPEAVYVYTSEVPAGPLTLQVGHNAPQRLNLKAHENRFVAIRTLDE